MRFAARIGDITACQVDAIVNAANSSLLGGGGVDGAIHRAAGPQLLLACEELRRTSLPNGLPVGQAIATPGFELPARWVIHTVGPNWHVGERDPELLGDAVRNSLAVAADLGATSIAFPAISAGAYGWEPAIVAKVMVSAASGTETTVSRLEFVLFSQRLLRVFDNQLAMER